MLLAVPPPFLAPLRLAPRVSAAARRVFSVAVAQDAAAPGLLATAWITVLKVYPLVN